MKFIRWLAVFVSITFILSITACTSQSADCFQLDTFCVGLVTAYNGIDNGGLNQVTWEALVQAKKEAHITHINHIESIDSRDWGKNIAFFADRGYDIIVTVGFELGDETFVAAGIYPEIVFIGVDQLPEGTHPNLASISFKEEQVGFLAGTLAAMFTTTGNIGAVCETSDLTSMWNYCEGFRSGAKYVDISANIAIMYRDNGSRDKLFNDPNWGNQVAQRLIQDGVDVIFAVGRGTAEGVFLKAIESSTFIIRTEENFNLSLPDSETVLLTQITKDPGEQLSNIISETSQGKIASGIHWGNIIYAPLNNLQKQTSSEITTKFEELYLALLEGDIEISLPEKR